MERVVRLSSQFDQHSITHHMEFTLATIYSYLKSHITGMIYFKHIRIPCSNMSIKRDRKLQLCWTFTDILNTPNKIPIDRVNTEAASNPAPAPFTPFWPQNFLILSLFSSFDKINAECINMNMNAMNILFCPIVHNFIVVSGLV